MPRIFIALPLSDNFKTAIGNWQNKHVQWPVRFVVSENLHLTLLAPWQTVDLDKEIFWFEKFKTGIKPFLLEFEVIRFGPNAHNPRLIWLEGKCCLSLDALQKEAARFWQQPAGRAFLPHITLARFKTVNIADFAAKDFKEKFVFQEKFDSMVLMRSFLLPDGAKYEILAQKNFLS